MSERRTAQGRSRSDEKKAKAEKLKRTKRIKKAEKGRKAAEKKELNSVYKKRKDIIFWVIFFGLLILISLWRSAVISELEYKNADLKHKKERLENKVSDLNTNIEQTKESDWLRTQAEDRINMRDARKGEIVTLDLKPEKKENKIKKFFKELFK